MPKPIPDIVACRLQIELYLHDRVGALFHLEISSDVQADREVELDRDLKLTFQNLSLNIELKEKAYIKFYTNCKKVLGTVSLKYFCKIIAWVHFLFPVHIKTFL